MILCIETATSACSVAICSAGSAVSLKESRETRSHASLLTGFIKELLDEQGIKASDLDAVAVSKGPGSYTGLRIGVSAAKGIAYAASVPLIGIDTPLAMYHGMKMKAIGMGFTGDDLLCPMIDARRMEVFYAFFGLDGTMKDRITAEVIDRDSFASVAPGNQVLFFGDGAQKCEKVIDRKNSLFITDFSVSASFMSIPAYDAYSRRNFEDVAYFEPFYLKDFIATIPRKNIIGRELY